MEQLDGGSIKEVERISREAEALNGATVEIGGHHYWVRDKSFVAKPDPAPECLLLNTLQSLIDYVRDQPDAKFVGDRKRFVAIVSPTCVRFWTGADGPNLMRRQIVEATAVVPAFAWGKPWSVEDFIVSLRTCFVLTDGVKQVIDYFSHIDSSNAVTLSEDGMSQQIAITRGARGKVGVTVPNPLPLQPFRTFAEVIQPESPFLLRLYGGGNGMLPTVSLTEADMGQWRLAAIQNIKTKLVDSLPGVSVYG